MFFLLIKLIYCREYYIKLYGKELYLTGELSTDKLAKYGSFDDKSTFLIESGDKINQMKIIKSKVKNNLVLDTADGRKDLIFYPVHGLKNQIFNVIPLDFVNKFILENRNNCMTWNKDLGYIKVELCNGEFQNQIVEFVCADCVNDKADDKLPDEINKDTDEITSTPQKENPLGSKSMTKLIKGISTLMYELNECYIKNGTCMALDNHRELIHSYSPFGHYNNTSEISPDMFVRGTPIDKLKQIPLDKQVLNPEIHKKLIDLSDKERHLINDHNHPTGVNGDLLKNNHRFTQEEIFHKILPVYGGPNDVEHLIQSDVQKLRNDCDTINESLKLTANSETPSLEMIIENKDPSTDSVFNDKLGNPFINSLVNAAENQVNAISKLANDLPEVRDQMAAAANKITNNAIDSIDLIDSIFKK